MQGHAFSRLIGFEAIKPMMVIRVDPKMLNPWRKKPQKTKEQGGSTRPRLKAWKLNGVSLAWDCIWILKKLEINVQKWQQQRMYLLRKIKALQNKLASFFFPSKFLHASGKWQVYKAGIQTELALNPKSCKLWNSRWVILLFQISVFYFHI